jgi:hypothetical protein
VLLPLSTNTQSGRRWSRRRALLVSLTQGGTVITERDQPVFCSVPITESVRGPHSRLNLNTTQWTDDGKGV